MAIRLERQGIIRLCGTVGAVCVGMLWAGCASVGYDTAAAAPAAASPAAASPAVTNPAVVTAAVTPALPADGFEWNTLARMAAANCSEAKALLLEAQAERYQTAVDTGWRNPQVRMGHHSGNEDEETAARSGMRTYPDEVGTPSRSFTRNREWGDRSFDGETVGLRVYTANPFVNRWLRKRGAASEKALEKEAEEEAYAVFCEVRTLCLNAELLREETALLEQMAEIRDQLRAVRHEQAEAGVTSPLDLIRAETRVASLRSEIREKQTARQQLVRRIAVLAGICAEQVILRPRSAVSNAVAEAFLEPSVLTDMAFLRRPDLVRAEREKEAAEHGLKAAKAGQIPWFEYIEGVYEEEDARAYSYEGNFSGRDRTTQNETEWQVRLAVTVPVFNWLGDEIKLTRAQLAAAETRVCGLYEMIRLEVGGVLEDYRAARGERDRLMSERERLCKTMTVRIDALAQEPTVKREEVLAAREELVAYQRICLKAESECLYMAQYLETVSGGPLWEER